MNMNIANPVTLESILAHTACQLKEVKRGLDLYLSQGRISAENYTFARGISKLYEAESHLDVIASNKILVQPHLIGLYLDVFYTYNPNRDIYEIAHVGIQKGNTIQGVENLASDLTDTIRDMMGLFSNSEFKTIPYYLNYSLFKNNGCALSSDSEPPPRGLCVTVCVTPKALEVIEKELDQTEIIMAWMTNPKSALRDKTPKVDFVATDIRSSTGYLSASYDIPKDINDCISYFQLTKKSLMERLFGSGFKTAIVFTSGNDQSLVRGTVMGASHLCIENYIAPALESIKATRMKVRAIKTDKGRKRFIKATLDKAYDDTNILNYLRTFDYFVDGMTVEPNYTLVRRRVQNTLEDGVSSVYVDPSISGRLKDSSVIELVDVMGVGVSDAVQIVEYSGYDGIRNVFTKKLVREMKRDIGVELTDEQVETFKEAFSKVRANRETNGTVNLIMLKERLWNVENV